MEYATESLIFYGIDLCGKSPSKHLTRNPIRNPLFSTLEDFARQLELADTPAELPTSSTKFIP
jgi:hypothetical protein